ncbi:hypothetical protein BH24CHL5_BH24CHL5_03470 [soil metagenome]
MIAGGAGGSLVAMFLPWWVLTRTNAAPLAGGGLEGGGIIIFLAALTLLVVITLPYAARGGESALDRPATYVVLTLVALAGFVARLLEISGFGGLRPPIEAPGLWLAGAALLVVAWGVASVLAERPDY